MLKKSWIYIITLFLFVLSQGLLADENHQELSYDDAYAISIIDSTSFTDAPNAFNPFWRAFCVSAFSNGLNGFTVTEWQYESQVKEEIELFGFRPAYENINILSSYRLVQAHLRGFIVFDILFESGKISSVALAIDKAHNFEHQPKIISVTENINKIQGWIFNKYQYQYIVELDDSTIWTTQISEDKNSSKWLKNWDVGTQVIVIGNSKTAGMVNLNILQSERLFIEKEDVLGDLKRIR